MNNTYSTLAKSSESLFKDKGSKHIGVAIPVDSKEQIDQEISRLKKLHGKANHVCYAFALREKSSLKTFSQDDGEPKNSAGPPILGQIKSHELENVLVAVIRYFGGTKLGVSGLINAYKTAAKLAIDANQIIQRESQSQYQLRYDYAVFNDVRRIIKRFDSIILNEENSMTCSMTVSIPSRLGAEFNEEINQLQNLKCELLD